MALSEWLQYNAAPPSVINNFSGHTTINGVIIHVLVGLVDKEERKEEASCCKDKVRKSLLILCSFTLSHARKIRFYISVLFTHTGNQQLSLLVSLSGQRHNKTEQREMILSWRKSEEEGTDTRLHNDRIFLQGRGNLMLFGCELQYGNRGSSPW